MADSFDHYMRAGTATWTPTAAAAPVWPESGTVIDVGDGIGLLLADVLHTHPHLRSFLCEHHAGQVPSATPMTQEDVAELAERRAQHHRALAGQPYQPPNPIKD